MKSVITVFVNGVEAKACSLCSKILPLDSFNIHTRAKTGRQSRCKDCKAAVWIKYCETRLFREREPAKVAYRKLKKRLQRIEALQHYSKSEHPHCNCCGETTYEFLALDHIYGGGNKHRKSDPKATNIYRWVKKNNYPPMFQVLCHNCNMAKGFFGECPHTKESTCKNEEGS